MGYLEMIHTVLIMRSCTTTSENSKSFQIKSKSKGVKQRRRILKKFFFFNLRTVHFWHTFSSLTFLPFPATVFWLV